MFFFFSSRRRHTRFDCDWSSDVCSSDLGFDEHVKLHVTGCPNSCGQHWIADIGIEGKKVKVDGALVDAYYFCVGGALGRHSATARPIGLRVPAPDVGAAIERLLRAFLAERRPRETF